MYVDGWFVNYKALSQVARSVRVEADVAERSEFLLCSRINGHPVERSKPRRGIVSLGNSQDTVNCTVLNFL